MNRTRMHMNKNLKPIRGVARVGCTAAGVLLVVGCLGCGSPPEPSTPRDPPIPVAPAEPPAIPESVNPSKPKPEQLSPPPGPNAQEIVASLRKGSPQTPLASAVRFQSIDAMIEQALIHAGSQWLDGLRTEIQQAIKNSNRPEFNIDQVLTETRKRMDSGDDKAVQQALSTVRQDIPEVLKLRDSYPTAAERLTNETSSDRMGKTLSKASAEMTNLVLEEASVNLGFPPGTMPKARSALDRLIDELDKPSPK